MHAYDYTSCLNLCLILNATDVDAAWMHVTVVAVLVMITAIAMITTPQGAGPMKQIFTRAFGPMHMALRQMWMALDGTDGTTVYVYGTSSWH